MNKLFFIIGTLLMALAVLGGFGVGLGLFAYSIWTIILLIKGTLAVTFWAIFKVVACWCCAILFGWLWFLLFGFLGGLCLSFSKPDKKRYTYS